MNTTASAERGSRAIPGISRSAWRMAGFRTTQFDR